MAISPELNARFNTLKLQLMQNMNQRGADSSARIKRVGVDAVRIVRSANQEGEDALILDSNGRWSKHFLMSRYEIGDVGIERVIEEYALILDLEFQLLSVQEFELPEEEFEAKRQAYLIANQERLMGGILLAMERLVAEMGGIYD